MKKLPVLMATLLAVVLTGCSTPKEDPTGAVNNQEFQACLVQPTASQDDGALAKLAKSGLEKANKELGIKVTTEEAKAMTEVPAKINKLVDQKCTVILGVGQGAFDDFVKSAKANPKVKFVLVDAQIPEGKTGAINLKTMRFDIAQAAYLAGYLAAGTTITGKVGTFGSKQIPGARQAMAGFANGVSRYNTDNGTAVSCNWNTSEQESLLFDSLTPDKVAEQTKQILSKGADIVMPVAGQDGQSALSQVNGNNALIWFGIDGYAANKGKEGASVVMTSVLKNADAAVLQVIKDIKANKIGNFQVPWVGTLENKGVGIAPLNEFEKRIPTDLVNEVATLSEQIKAGNIEVLPEDSTH